MAIVRWPARPTQPWKPRPDQQQQTCLSNSQPSHKSDYNLDDDGDGGDDDDDDDDDDDGDDADDGVDVDTSRAEHSRGKYNSNKRT